MLNNIYAMLNQHYVDSFLQTEGFFCVGVSAACCASGFSCSERLFVGRIL